MKPKGYSRPDQTRPDLLRPAQAGSSRRVLSHYDKHSTATASTRSTPRLALSSAVEAKTATLSHDNCMFSLLDPSYHIA